MEVIEQKCIKCRKIVGKIETLIPNDTFNVDILCFDCARKVMEQNIIDNKESREDDSALEPIVELNRLNEIKWN